MVVGTGQDGKNFLESSSCRPHELKSEESASVDASTTFNITLGCLAKILVVDASVIKWPQVTGERLFLCIRCVLKGEFLPLIIGTKSMQREPRGVAATRGGRDREALLSISSYPSLTVCFPRMVVCLAEISFVKTLPSKGLLTAWFLQGRRYTWRSIN